MSTTGSATTGSAATTGTTTTTGSTATTGSTTTTATGTSGTTGGSSGGCACAGGQECTTDGHCIDPKVIDDFADCNTTIYSIRGRSGGWYAAGDVGINVSFAVSTPPSGYSDRRCGAWTTGGPTGNGTTNFALLGVSLAPAGAAANLSGYSGLSLSLEAQSVDFVVKTTGGGYFTTRLDKTSGTQTFNVDFANLVPRSDSATSTLDLKAVTDLQFVVIDPSMGYGFVIHGVSLR